MLSNSNFKIYVGDRWIRLKCAIIGVQNFYECLVISAI